MEHLRQKNSGPFQLLTNRPYKLLMAGFEPASSGVGSDRSANRVTTTAHPPTILSTQTFYLWHLIDLHQSYLYFY